MLQETVELNLFVPEDAKAKDVEARGGGYRELVQASRSCGRSKLK